jgi:hypothetical protein
MDECNRDLLTIIALPIGLRCEPFRERSVLMSRQCTNKVQRFSAALARPNPGLCQVWLIAEPTRHGKQVSFFPPSKTVPSPLLLAPQLSRAGLSGMRHLWDCLRIRLRSYAACPEAGRAFGQSRRVQELKIQKTVNTRLFEILPL